MNQRMIEHRAARDEMNLVFFGMPRVIHIYNLEKQPDAIYIGRPSYWGNPFVIGKDGSREQVIAKYREWVMKQPRMLNRIRLYLRGRSLACHCTPEPCHGEVLLAIANR